MINESPDSFVIARVKDIHFIKKNKVKNFIYIYSQVTLRLTLARAVDYGFKMSNESPDSFVIARVKDTIFHLK